MKFFLACVTTTLAICVTAVSLHAFDEEPAGQTSLSDQGSNPQPVPHVIGSGGPAGQAIVGGGYTLPNRPVYYDNMLNANIGYQMSEDIFTVQYRIEHRAGGLQGYNDGYTDFGAFIPMMTSANSLFFTDIRGIVTNNSDGGLNVGFGRRWYDPNGDRVWSGSAWYGYDGGNVDSYQNLGLSASMTSRYWRYRVNGYGVVGDQSNFIGTQIDNTNPFLLTDEIHLNRTRVREAAYHGVDATIGGPMPLLGRFGINWDTGVYYNWANDGEPGDDGLGWMFSSDAQLTEDINLAVRYTNDNIFGANAQMSLAVNIPDGRASRILRQPSVRDYMLRQDERKYRSSVKRYNVNDTVALLNATDSLPIKVANIIPAATAGVIASGDGTIENPFNTTAAWQALSGAAKAEFDIVLVRPGIIPTGADYMNNLTSGMTIVENQRLLSSTGRLVRTLGTGGNELISYAGHSVLADVTGLGTGLTFTIPQTGELLDGTSLIGTIFDPTNDPRPILANHTNVVSTRPHAVVAIDNSFAVACSTNTEVSGFIIDGTNPNMPTMPNNGIVTGNILNPALGTGVTGFDINSNFIRDAVHGVHITSLGDSFGTILLNRVEGDGFNSNSGINIFHSGGALGLRFEDNLAYNIFGEDIDNDGVLDVVPGGTEDTNGNGKLDIGEDLDGDGVIDVDEDNDKDGLLSDDDLGIGFNIVADSAGATIISNDTANNLHIVRNVTHLLEAEYFRTQTVDTVTGIVTNAYTAQDINGDVTLIPPVTVVQSSDTLDNVGNKNGMNLEARDGATLLATVADNDTSFNNPYEAGLMPPVKNPLLSVVPTALGNEFGFRARSIGVGSVLTLSSPDRHISNNNFGHGAIFEALDTSTLTMINPMQGAFTTSTAGAVTGSTPSQYNFNGLNGLLIRETNTSTMTVQIGQLSDTFDGFHLNEFLSNGQDGDITTPGNGIEIDITDSTLLGYIAHNNISESADNGILFGNTNSLVDNIAGSTELGFTIKDNNIQSSVANGIFIDFLNAPTDNLRIDENNITGTESALGLAFLIDGNTFGQPFSITNSSAATRNIANLVLDITSSNTLFDTVEPGASIPFLPSGGSDVLTGLIAVNGTAITQGSSPLADDLGNVLVGGGVPDDSQVLTLAFNDFAPTEAFVWVVDLDTVGAPASTVLGSDLIGSTVSVTFDNGSILSGSLVAVAGNADASEFVASATGTPTVGDGIRFDLENSTLTDLTVNRNTISGNGQNGINFESVINSNLSNVIIEGNEITDNPNADGIRMLNPQFATNAEGDNQIHYRLNTINNNGGYGINMTLNNANHLDSVICANDISGNTLGGVNVELSDDSIYHSGLVPPDSLLTPAVDVESWFFGNTINNNSGIGFHLTAADNSQFSLIGTGSGANTLNGNQDAGVGIEMTGTSSGILLLDNITASNNIDTNPVATNNTNFQGDGIAVIMTDFTTLSDPRIGSSVLTSPDVPTFPTVLDGNAGDGLSFEISGNAVIQDTTADLVANGLQVLNVQANSNGQNGLNFTREGNAQYQGVIIDNPTTNTNTLSGINIEIAGGASDFLNPPASFTQTFLIQNGLIDANTDNGIDLLATGDGILSATITGNDITNNLGNGIEGDTNQFGQLTGIWSTNNILSSGVDGIWLTATRGEFNNILPSIDVDILQNVIDLSGVNGIHMDSNVNDNSSLINDVVLTINGNTITNSIANDGILINSNLRSEVLIDQLNDNIISDNANVGLNLFTNGVINNTFFANTSTLTVAQADSNTIVRNVSDGVAMTTLNPLTNNATAIDSTGFLNAIFTDNVVSFNGANGFNILNTGESDMTISIGGTAFVNLANLSLTDPNASVSRVTNNGSNGIRVENNAGGLLTDNDITIGIFDTLISGNGTNAALADIERNGTYLRIGTSGGFGGVFDPADPLGRLVQAFGGEVQADVQRNMMVSNANVDFTTESFVATPDPLTRSNSNFGLSFDPKAFFGLRFIDNLGDQIDITRSGAFYTNADEFKSNVIVFNGPNSVGTTRRRNAQRLDGNQIAALVGTVRDPPAPANTPAAGTTAFSGPFGFPNVAVTVPLNLRFFTASVLFNGGANAGQRRNIRSYSNDAFTTDIFPAVPVAGDAFQVDVYNLAGIGQSTFRTTETTVNVNNLFTNVISDFTFDVPLGPPTGAGSADPFNTTADQDFEWSTGVAFPVSFPF